MPRSRLDGSPARPPRKRKLTDLYVRRVRPESAAFAVWDERARGLVLRVQPGGSKAWKIVYRHHGRPRWYHVGDAGAIGLADARRIAARIALAAAEGKDPVAERRAERGAGTFAELVDRYREHAMRKNKSWAQADGLVRRYLVPRWGKLEAKSIARADVKALVGKIAAPILANQILASASAVFSWAAKEEIIAINPCKGVERHETSSRERVLADGELPRFWAAFDGAGLVASSALKTILMSGQRPGEVAHMRREHLIDGWWEMPGDPDPKVGWPGTKNGASHRVWLPVPVRAIIAELTDDGAKAGFVFAASRGRPVELAGPMRAISSKIGGEKVVPHDLRRSFCSRVTGLGFGRDAMDRIANHRTKLVRDIYDRHGYGPQDQKIMEAVAVRIVEVVEGRALAGLTASVLPVR